MMNSISDNDLVIINEVLGRFPQVQKAVLFGSRAKGNHKIGSDIDIALFLDGEDICAAVSGILNDETSLPYKFDVLNISTISNPDLLAHIRRVGITLYTKS